VWKLWRATEDAGLAGLALRFMFLTACRVKEATCLPWSEIDFKAKVWTLPASRNKSARERSIPLSKQALAVLRKADSVGAFAFGRVQLHEPLKAIRKAMGVSDWEPRDIRRTAGTTCARLGLDPFVVSLVLGHARADERMPEVTKTYLRHRYEEQVRKALDSLGQWVEDTVNSEKEPGPGEVISIDSARA
jgi:integrase